MSTGLIKLIKQVALDAMEAGQPTDIRQGVVTSVNPLNIQITPQFTLPASVLIVPKRLTDHTISVSTFDGVETITIYNALKVNDKVALLRQKGGQSYLILDRI